MEKLKWLTHSGMSSSSSVSLFLLLLSLLFRRSIPIEQKLCEDDSIQQGGNAERGHQQLVACLLH